MKITKKLFSLAFTFFISIHFCSAQKIQLIQKDHTYNNIGSGSTTFDWSHAFVLEGESNPRKAGYFGQHLKKHLKSDSIAIRHLNSYATHQTFKLITATSTVVLFSVFGISNLTAKSVSQEHLDNPLRNPGFLYAAAGTGIANFILRVVRPKSIIKAIDSYNQKGEEKNISFNSMNFNAQTISGSKTFNVGIKFNL